MKTSYVIPISVKDILQKKLENLNKKAISYGNKLEWSFTDEIVMTQNIYSEENFILKKINERKVFGIGITIESDIIQKEGWTVIAGIEHQDSGNIVYMYDEDSQIDLRWYTMPAYCEHCNTRHVKKFSYIVRDKENNFKQVGRACLRDYCGISPQMIVSAMELRDLILNEYNIDKFDFSKSGDYAIDVMEAIGLAYDITKKFGYIKSCEENSTKSMLIEKILSYDHPSEAGKEIANEMQTEIGNMEYHDLSDFLRNIKSMIKAKYVRFNGLGYLAYAPIAYQKMKELKKQEEIQEITKKDSSFIGNIGDRVTLDIHDMKLITSYETVYGWTHIYKFFNSDNNILVWFSSKYIEDNPVKLVGTIKDHKEYNGEKQTVLTRCKILGVA